MSAGINRIVSDGTWIIWHCLRSKRGYIISDPRAISCHAGGRETGTLRDDGEKRKANQAFGGVAFVCVFMWQ